MKQNNLRELSGNVVFPSADVLTNFFYTLLRDEVPVGGVEGIVSELEEASLTDTVLYTNGWLAKYANNLSSRLGAVLDRSKGLYFNPKPVANAILPKDDGFLLIERADGGWAFPGGFQERECIFEALAREVKEEIGVELDASPKNWKFIYIQTTCSNTTNSMFFQYLLDIDWNKLITTEEAINTRVATIPEQLKFISHTAALELAIREKLD